MYSVPKKSLLLQENTNLYAESNGGSFCSGFLSGALSSGIGSYISGTGMSADFIIGSATLAGGLSSLAAGGNFIDGALRGMQIGLLNHAIHDDFEMTHDSYGNMVGYIGALA